jgi:hypothetical protein
VLRFLSVAAVAAVVFLSILSGSTVGAASTAAVEQPSNNQAANGGRSLSVKANTPPFYSCMIEKIVFGTFQMYGNKADCTCR